MAEPPQTDVSRPSALPTAKLLQRPTFNQALVDQNSDEYLDAIEEEWNKKLDAEVEVLVDGMVDIVSLASIGDKDKFRIAQESFQAESRAESMVRAANSLLSITHSLKLLLLLSDEAQIAHRLDAELKHVQQEKNEARQKVAELLDAVDEFKKRIIAMRRHSLTISSNSPRPFLVEFPIESSHLAAQGYLYPPGSSALSRCTWARLWFPYLPECTPSHPTIIVQLALLGARIWLEYILPRQPHECCCCSCRAGFRISSLAAHHHITCPNASMYLLRYECHAFAQILSHSLANSFPNTCWSTDTCSGVM
ncbi:hypothetical protein F4604DRAFT_445748 [Suillus subluteus]|nr:hypothetical protein F4604DRAFT_445748 [Suillus subluteus]